MTAAGVLSDESAASGVRARADRYDWSTLTNELGAYGSAVMEKLLSADECREVPGGRPVPQPCRYVEARVWQRRIPLFLLSAPESDRRREDEPVSSSRRNRQCLERADES